MRIAVAATKQDLPCTTPFQNGCPAGVLPPAMNGFRGDFSTRRAPQTCCFGTTMWPRRYTSRGHMLRGKLAAVLIAIGLAVAPQSVTYAQSPSNPLIDGLWLAGGSGQLVEIKQNILQIYEITDASCIPAGNAKRRPGAKPGEVVFEGRQIGTLRVTAADGSDSLWLHHRGVSSVALQRAPGLPETCGHKTPDTPKSNYEVFWRTFYEHYPFSARRQVDWSAVDKKLRPQINESTSPAELFGVFQQMIEPLFDAHTGIDAKTIHRSFHGRRADAETQQGARAGRIREIIQQKYVRGNLQNYCHLLGLGSKPQSPQSLLHFGFVGDSIGYLRIDAFPPGCDGELDKIFREAAELKGLIIDERLNVDGSNAFAFSLASRLTNHDYLAYSIATRSNAPDNGHRTPPQPVMVHASARPGFSGEVALLIGPDSVSAAGVFAMALFGRKPRITRVGDNTQGVFSDMLERTLPNGWRFSLPNGTYLAEDGRAFDVVGVPPDVRVPVFPDQDLRDGRDSALEKAIDLLGQTRD